MSTISTRLPSAATVVEAPLEVARDSVISRARGRVRTPWTLVVADVVAGLGTAAVFLYLLMPDRWPVAMWAFVLAWPACVAVTVGYAHALGVRHPVHPRALVAAGADARYRTDLEETVFDAIRDTKDARDEILTALAEYGVRPDSG